MKRIFFILFLFFAACLPCKAQFKNDSTVRMQQDTTGFVMHKDPLLSLAYSAVLPGAGQIYNAQWWKAPIIWAGMGACLYGAFLQNHRLKYTQDSINNQIARGDLETASLYTAARDFYRDDRDKFYIYAALVYIANLLDAYIAAHLFDFDVTDAGTIPYISAPTGSDDHWRLGVTKRW